MPPAPDDGAEARRIEIQVEEERVRRMAERMKKDTSEDAELQKQERVRSFSQEIAKDLEKAAGSPKRAKDAAGKPEKVAAAKPTAPQPAARATSTATTATTAT